MTKDVQEIRLRAINAELRYVFLYSSNRPIC